MMISADKESDEDYDLPKERRGFVQTPAGSVNDSDESLRFVSLPRDRSGDKPVKHGHAGRLRRDV